MGLLTENVEQSHLLTGDSALYETRSERARYGDWRNPLSRDRPRGQSLGSGAAHKDSCPAGDPRARLRALARRAIYVSAYAGSGKSFCWAA